MAFRRRYGRGRRRRYGRRRRRTTRVFARRAGIRM